MERKKAWSLNQLHFAMLKDIESCNTQLEINTVKSICGKEIRAKAEEFSKARKLTPCEVVIASEFGFK